MRDLIDLVAEFVVGGIGTSHPVDLSIQTRLQLPIAVFHRIDILICGRIGRRDHTVTGSVHECRTAGEACGDHEEYDTGDPQDQENI